MDSVNKQGTGDQARASLLPRSPSTRKYKCTPNQAEQPRLEQRAISTALC